MHILFYLLQGYIDSIDPDAEDVIGIHYLNNTVDEFGKRKKGVQRVYGEFDFAEVVRNGVSCKEAYEFCSIHPLS
jgi:hypothetical protein